MGLDAVELVTGLEEEFGVRIPDSVTEQMLTPRHVIDWMCAQKEQGALFSVPVSKTRIETWCAEKCGATAR